MAKFTNTIVLGIIGGLAACLWMKYPILMTTSLLLLFLPMNWPNIKEAITKYFNKNK